MRIINFLAVSSIAFSVISPVWGADAVCEGRRAWLRLNCAGCHGALGTGGMGPNIQNYDGGGLESAMIDGRYERGMISYLGKVLNDPLTPKDANGKNTNVTLNQQQIYQDAQNMGKYLASVRAGTDPRFVDWWKKAPPTTAQSFLFNPYITQNNVSCSFTTGTD